MNLRPTPVRISVIFIIFAFSFLRITALNPMEIFLSREMSHSRRILSEDEAMHCVKVLRHREGDIISVIDGEGTMYRCRITSASARAVEAEILSSEADWGAHPYRLRLAVAPTKNTDRYEWFAEKACEIGVDEIIPIIGARSERKIFKTERIRKILTAAAKQSLKGAVPKICEPMSVRDFISEVGAQPEAQDGAAASAETASSEACLNGKGSSRAEDPLKLIAYCFEDESHPRISIKEALERYTGLEVTVMIGPEGDFSPEEAQLALSRGFIPVHLGRSRLRTETAAVTAAEAAYFRWME